MLEKSLHICHLTVLNPARHSRIFFKEAVSQAQAGYQVTVIGQDAASAPYFESGVKIVPIGEFGRLSWGRMTARRRILDLARETQADLFQIHAPELLGVGEALKVDRPKVRLIYDQHEDYPANIRFGAGYPGWLRKPLARLVERKIRNFTRIGDGVIYAEDCYEPLKDIPGCVVRNKFRQPLELERGNLPLIPRLLYTGTIADAWGIGRTLELWQGLNRLAPVDLVVAGHSQEVNWAWRLKEKVAAMGLTRRFRLLGNGNYIPHEQIIAEIAKCSAGTAFYELAPHLRDKVPTKFYEFMGMRKPLLFSQNPAWDRLNDNFGFGHALSFPLTDSIVAATMAMLEKNTTLPAIPDSAWSWECEEGKMLDFLAEILVPSCS